MKSLSSTAGRLALSLFAFKNSDSAVSAAVPVAAQHDDGSSCRSNSTHIVWKSPQMATMPAFGRRRAQISVSSTMCNFQLRQDAEKECLHYLDDNLMALDKPFRETLGFPTEDTDAADGLDNGMVGPTIRLALDTKVQFEWTDDLPKHIFLEYVLNFANLNEARTNWRPLITDALNYTNSSHYRSGSANLTSTVTWVNTHLWTKLARDEDRPIFFKSSQTPLIFDPMSIIAFGYASCTGTAILFSNALRAVGVPSRVVGTPAWYGNATQGNHNWVEVYDDDDNGGDWKFLEPSPALPHVDTLDQDPCSRWFCRPSRYPASKVYAARYSKQYSAMDPDPATHFPLAWEWDCYDVPAVDRTQYYTEVCGLCED
jgi:hypothetical protein